MATPTTAPRPMTRLNTPAGRPQRLRMSASAQPQPGTRSAGLNTTQLPYASAGAIFQAGIAIGKFRSEEHTSELQSQSNLVCRLLLEKKKRHGVPPLLSGYSFDSVPAIGVSFYVAYSA